MKSSKHGKLQLKKPQTDNEAKRLRTDNGLEYWNKRFDDYCAENGITRHMTVRNTSQQNVLVERMNRTLIDKVRCMLIHFKLPMSLWVEALSTAKFVFYLNSAGICRLYNCRWVWKDTDKK